MNVIPIRNVIEVSEDIGQGANYTLCREDKGILGFLNHLQVYIVPKMIKLISQPYYLALTSIAVIK